MKTCSYFIALGLAVMVAVAGAACGDDAGGDGEAGAGGAAAGSGESGASGSAGRSGSDGASCGADGDSCSVDDDCPWPVQCVCNPCGQSFGPARKCLDGCCLNLDNCCDYACEQ